MAHCESLVHALLASTCAQAPVCSRGFVAYPLGNPVQATLISVPSHAHPAAYARQVTPGAGKQEPCAAQPFAVGKPQISPVGHPPVAVQASPPPGPPLLLPPPELPDALDPAVPEELLAPVLPEPLLPAPEEPLRPPWASSDEAAPPSLPLPEPMVAPLQAMVAKVQSPTQTILPMPTVYGGAAPRAHPSLSAGVGVVEWMLGEEAVSLPRPLLIALVAGVSFGLGFSSSRLLERTARAQAAPFASSVYVPSDGLAFRTFEGRVIARLSYDHRGAVFDLYDIEERPTNRLRADVIAEPGESTSHGVNPLDMHIK